MFHGGIEGIQRDSLKTNRIDCQPEFLIPFIDQQVSKISAGIIAYQRFNIFGHNFESL